MILRRLAIDNFKNIGAARLEFSPKANCLLGNNGMGKSNLLDAIYYLSFCKSFNGVQDVMLVKRDEEFCIVNACYLRRDVEEELSLGMSRGKRKTLKRKGKEYQRLSQHIGLFPLVIIAPNDIDIIRGNSDERRRFIDMIISQSDRTYLDCLIKYNKALEQRNKLLRDGCVDHNLYVAIEMTMAMAAGYINRQRREWVDRLSDIFNRYYKSIAGDGEQVELRYQSRLNDAGATMETLLDGARRHDEVVKHTSVGIHRDDIDMSIAGMPVRRTGSQGQCKTFTIALRLAQYEMLSAAANLKPLLLLDDIFDKLDATRVERIMEIVMRDTFGQIFITDTNRTHLDRIISQTSGDYRIWEVCDGSFNPITSDVENETP